MAKPNGCKEHFWKEKGCKDCEAVVREAERHLPSAGLDGSTANDLSSVGECFTDEEAQKVLSFFADAGMRIELGAQYSAKGQIAQLLNGARELLKHVERDVLA